MAEIPMRYRVDLDKTINTTPLNTLFAMGDAQAHRFELTITHGSVVEDLTGCTVKGKFVSFSNNMTVNLTGSVTGGNAVVTLTQACYAQLGRFALVIQIIKGSVKTSVFYGDGYMRSTTTDNAIDGNYIVYDTNVLLSKIQEIENAISGANAAIANANAAAENVDANMDAKITARVDKTLSVEDGIADAKKVGEEIGSLKGDLSNIGAKEKRSLYKLSNGDIASDGSISSSTTYGVTDLIDVKYVKNNYVNMDDGVAVYIAQYDGNGDFISIKKYTKKSVIDLNDNAKFVRLNSKLVNEGKFYICYNIISEKDMDDRFGTIANISPNLSITKDIMSMFISGKDLDDNGNEINNPNFACTPYIYSRYLRTTKYQNTSNETIYLYLFDGDKLYLGRVSYSKEAFLNLRDDCVYVRICTKVSNLSSITISSITEMATIYDVCKQYGQTVSVELRTILDYGDLDDNGEYVRSTYKKVTPRFIKVNGITGFIATFVGNLSCAEYDKDKNFVKKYSITTGNTNDISERTRYIKFQADHNSEWEVSVIFNNLKNVEYEKNEYKGYDTIPFEFQFYGNKGVDYDGTNVDVDTSTYYTSGLLRLPPNYSSAGDKVPLIYFAHGSGDYLDRNDTEFSNYYMDYIQYLQDEGFAIMDVNGNTSKYSTTGGCQWGNPTNMSAIKQGIRWVCTNYNVDINRVYVMSKSLGGLQAINMCYENDMHIKACCPLAPELDMLCDGLGYYPNERKNNADDLGFSEDVNNVLDTPYDKSTERLYKKSDEYKQYIRENASKLLGYNPAWRGVIGISAAEMVEYPISGDYVAQGQKMSEQNRYCVVPTKIFIAKDDTAVSYEMSKGYIQSLKNGGCVGELRTMPNGTGGHHAVDNDPNALKVSEVKTYCGVIHQNVPLAYVELVQFFKRYS